MSLENAVATASRRNGAVQSASRRQPLVSVIIVNFNGGALFVDAVDAVLHSHADVEVFVVDNGSEDSSLSWLCQRVGTDPRLRLIENERNLGFAKAGNIALREAHGDHVLLLNPDCIVQPDTLNRMLAALATRPDVGMAGCLIRNPDGTEQAGCRRAMPEPGRALARVLHIDKVLPGIDSFVLSDQPLPPQPITVDAISGAFMLLPRTVVDDVGPLDEGYFLHCEDLDWCARVREQGWQILFVPDVEVVHHKGTCSKDRPIRVSWHKHRGMVRFYKKFFRRRYPLPLLWLVVLGTYGHFGLQALGSAAVRLLRGLRPRSDLPAQTTTFPALDGVAAIDREADRPGHTGVTDAAGTHSEHPLRGRTVLVTGATGFVGRHLVSALLQDPGTDVRVLARNVDAVTGLWPQRVHPIHADLTVPKSLRGCCRDVDTVFHLASYDPAAAREVSDPAHSHWRVTVEGTRALLAEAAGAGVRRFVFVSSVTAMGEGGEACLDETSRRLPASAYGRAKFVAERLVLDAGRQHGTHVCVLRLPAVYGRDNQGNLPRMMAAIDRGRFPPLPDTANRRSLIHVDDVARALLLGAQRNEAHRRIYIVTDGQDYSTRQIYELICHALGRTVPRWHVPVTALKAGAWIGDIAAGLGARRVPMTSDTLDKLLGSACYRCSRIRTELGYVPTRTLMDALPEMVTEYRHSVPR